MMNRQSAPPAPAGHQSPGALAEYDPSKVNLLVPTQQIQQVSPWHAARVSEVRVDPDPNKGDVFKVGSRKNGNQWENLYALSKPALMRIASAAGIVWNWRDSGVVTATSDLVIYRAVGAIRLPDGSWQPVMATKEIDLKVIEEEIRERQTAANLKKKPEERLNDAQLEQAIRSELLQWRKNKLMRAETGAMLRVIRAALGMRSQYTAAELEKPFVVPRIDFSPDYSDPQVRQAVIEHGVKGMQSLFGAAAGPSSATAFLPPGASEGNEVRAPMLLEGAAADDAGDDSPAIQPAVDDGGDWLTGDDEDGESSKCSDCPNVIEDVTITVKGQQRFLAAPDIAAMSLDKFGRQLCYSCAERANKAARSGGGR